MLISMLIALIQLVRHGNASKHFHTLLCFSILHHTLQAYTILAILQKFPHYWCEMQCEICVSSPSFALLFGASLALSMQSIAVNHLTSKTVLNRTEMFVCLHLNS